MSVQKPSRGDARGATDPQGSRGAVSKRPARHEHLSSVVVHRGAKFALRTDVLALPGCAPEPKDFVQHPGSVLLIPLADDGRILLVEQWRPAIGKYSVELPSGTRDAGEESSATANRELREETGYRAERLEHLGGVYPLTGYSTEHCDIFVARDLVHDPLAQDTLEDIRVVATDVQEVWNLIAQNAISDALTVAALALAAMRHPELARTPEA